MTVTDICILFNF